MKKAVKLCLALALVIPTTMYTLNQETVQITAKINGNYSYEIIGDNTIEITNYNGAEKEVVIPSEIDGMKVTKIGYGAFAECKSIETLVIPETVTVIDSYAFSQCSQITSIVFPNSIVSMGRYAFAGNNNLKKVVLPNKLRSLGYGAFFECIDLEEVILPEGLQTIGSLAFGECKSLKEIAFPTSLVSIESNAFVDCISLQSVTIPKGVTTLGSGSFSGCLSLTSITLPNTVTGIAQSAFKDCIALREIVLPESLSAIGNGAFTGCTSLELVNIPSKVSNISNAMFSGCSSLETIVIPDTVEEIGEFAFSGCSSLEEINIPDSVKSIGASAFSYCGNLKNVRLSKNLTTIPSSMFRYSGSLETLILPNNITKIEATAFADCLNLKSVTFSNKVTEIGSRILSNSPEVVMSVVENSVSHTYAKSNNIAYQLITKGINLDKKELSMKVGDSNSFNVILAPYTILDNTQLTWTSSNPDCVSVDSNGKVTALKTGTATITVKNVNGLSDTATITVDDIIVPITEVKLNYETLTMKKETSLGIRATIGPTDTTMNKILQWESDNTEVATVSSTGNIFARAPGTTTIRVKTSNGLEAECIVKIISEIQSISLNQTAMALESGVKQTLRATINPSDTTDAKDISWVSSNTKVATVNQNGEVTTIAPGTATITAKTLNGKRAECRITVSEPVLNIPIDSVTLNEIEKELIEGDKFTLNANINPFNTTDSKILSWSSSDPNIASVDNGVVTAKNQGSATITVTTINGKKASCVIKVNRKVIEIASVSLNKTSLSLEEGKEDTLIATINPENTTEDKTLTWTSSDKSVATVDNGKVNAVKSGTATITVTTKNGKKDSCEVTITKKPIAIESVVLDITSAKIKVGNTLQLKASIYPSDTTDDKTLTWTSSNESVAKVSDSGIISAISKGVATIKVTTVNGLSAECIVTIDSINKTALKDLIKEADVITGSPYTKTSYATLSSVLASAKLLYENENAEQADINAMVTDLQNAIDSLVIKATTQQIAQLTSILVDCKKLESNFSETEFLTMKDLIDFGTELLAGDKDDLASSDVSDLYKKLQLEKSRLEVFELNGKLKKLIEIANVILEGDLSDINGQTIAELRKATSDAQYLIDTDSVDVDVLKSALDTLRVSIANCEHIVTKSHLTSMLELCKTYNEAEYTEESWNKFVLIMDEAEELILDVNATQKNIDDCYTRLTEGVLGLELKVNKVMLIYNVGVAKSIIENKESYLPSTIKGLDKVVAEAELLISNNSATSLQVKDMNDKVLNAIMKARLKEQ